MFQLVSFHIVAGGETGGESAKRSNALDSVAPIWTRILAKLANLRAIQLYLL